MMAIVYVGIVVLLKKCVLDLGVGKGCWRTALVRYSGSMRVVVNSTVLPVRHKQRRLIEKVRMSR